MTNELINLVQQFAGKAIVNNPAVPDSKNESVIESVADGILGGLKNEATSDGLGKLIGMFSSGSVSAPVSQSVQTSVVNSIMDKVGIQSATAKQIASAVVPLVLNALVKGVKDPNNSSLNGGNILSSLVGNKGNGIDFQALLDKGLGGSDGKFDLNDVMGMLGKNSGDNSAGGILGAVEGLFGKK